MTIQSIPLPKAFRLLNHGPVLLVSGCHNGTDNAMAAAWGCPLDYNPCRLTVVLDKSAFTRNLIEQSGRFAVQIPVQTQAELVLAMGRSSRNANPRKMDNVPLFRQAGFDVPLVAGCAAWLACRVLPEPHNQQTYDLFIGEVAAVWADDRVYADGRWLFDSVPDELKTLHYVGNGLFYRTGKGLKVG